MLTNDLILRNPLRLLGHENDDIIPPGGFGAVLARAGIGKTALVVQIALNSLLREKNVLHISLKEPIGKVNLRYQEVLDGMAQQYQLAHIEQLWDTVVHHRFIMTFQVEGFSVPKLEERLTDLTTQHIFNPQVIILDGVLSMTPCARCWSISRVWRTASRRPSGLRSRPIAMKRRPRMACRFNFLRCRICSTRPSRFRRPNK